MQKLKQTDAKPNLTPVELAQLTQKGPRTDAEYVELDESHLADKIEGIGHSKKDHINSGIFSGVETKTSSKDL